MLNAEQLREYLVRPTLNRLAMHSMAAENLVCGTVVTEATVGQSTCFKQLGTGPALGLPQMEPKTHDDIWINWLSNPVRTQTREMLKLMVAPRWWLDGLQRPSPMALVYDLDYAIGMCRVHYRRVSEPLPNAEDWPGLASYWRRHYNTMGGAGSVEKFLSDCSRCGIR